MSPPSWEWWFLMPTLFLTTLKESEKELLMISGSGVSAFSLHSHCVLLDLWLPWLHRESMPLLWKRWTGICALSRPQYPMPSGKPLWQTLPKILKPPVIRCSSEEANCRWYSHDSTVTISAAPFLPLGSICSSQSRAASSLLRQLPNNSCDATHQPPNHVNRLQ